MATAQTGGGDKVAINFKPPSLITNPVSGLNGAIPTQWDSQWQTYTDLSKEQIVAFQAMPEWQNFVNQFNSWLNPGPLQTNSGIAPSLTVAAAQAIQAGPVSKIS